MILFIFDVTISPTTSPKIKTITAKSIARFSKSSAVLT